MHLRWNVPLPGPFSVGGRVDGRASGGVIVGLAKLMYYLTLWLPVMLCVWSVRLAWWLGVEIVRGAVWLVRHIQAARARNNAPVTGEPDGKTYHLAHSQPVATHLLSPYLVGQLDAQRDRPRPPTYNDPRDAEQYVAGWRQTAPRRPVPETLRHR